MCHGAPNRFTVVNLYYCPADRNSPRTFTVPSDPQGFHSNYVACAGSTSFNTAGSNGGEKLNGLFFWKSAIKLVNITDGTSNTLMASEINLSMDTNSNHDVRGRMYNPARQGSILFSTLQTPNNFGTPDRVGYCVSVPQAPCTSTTTDLALYARSGHSGMVNAAWADGTVRPITDGVNATVYRDAGTRAGNETTQLD